MFEQYEHLHIILCKPIFIGLCLGVCQCKHTIKQTFWYFLQGPELLSKYIGASEQAVRDTFDR